ncbi:MAG: DUF4293 family protein [Salinibacter sp.]|uniref:DUF4293 family protein n=1 Tax=Salinibacter sp. TaxID=2065818 RepID=UPI0035D44220
MLQRRQTLYLLLGVLALGALGLFGTFWSGRAATEFAWFVPSLIGLLVVTIGTAVAAIFMYETHEQRKTQRTVVYGTQVLTLLLAGVLYGGLYAVGRLTFMGPTGVLWARSTALLLPILGYVFFRLARRNIEKDVERVERNRQGRIR